MAKRQTSVDWMVDQLRNQIKENGRLDAITISEFKMKAIAMEKEQIIEAYEQGEAEWTPVEFKTAQDYYNETYGK